MDGEDLASAPFEASNWSVYKDSFAPPPTRQKLKAWDRAPVPAHAPRLQGHRIWKKVSRNKQSQDNKENEEDAQAELEKEGEGARKRMRGLGGKENISDAPWLSNDNDEDTGISGTVSLNKKARLSLAVGDTDALLVPRKRTNTNHLITPRKPLRNLQPNSVTKAAVGAPGSAKKNIQELLADSLAQENDSVTEPGTPKEKPVRRRKSMRKSLRRLTQENLLQDVSPVLLANSIPDGSLSPNYASPTKVSPTKLSSMEDASLNGFEFKPRTSTPMKSDMKKPARDAAQGIFSSITVSGPTSMKSGAEAVDYIVVQPSPMRNSPKKSNLKVTFAPTVTKSFIDSIFNSPPQLDTPASEIDDDGDNEVASEQLANELRASSPSKPSPEDPESASRFALSFPMAADFDRMEPAHEDPFAVAPKKMSRVNIFSEDVDISKKSLEDVLRESVENRNAEVLEQESPTTSGNADLSHPPNPLSVSIHFTPRSSFQSPQMTAVEWGARLDPSSPTKTTRTPKRTRQTPKRAGPRRSSRTTRSSTPLAENNETPRFKASHLPVPESRNQAASGAFSDSTGNTENKFMQAAAKSHIQTHQDSVEMSEMSPAQEVSNIATAEVSRFNAAPATTAHFDMPDINYPEEPNLYALEARHDSGSPMQADDSEKLEVKECRDESENSHDEELPEHPREESNSPTLEPVDIFNSQESVASSEASVDEPTISFSTVGQPGGWVVESPPNQTLFHSGEEGDGDAGHLDDPMTSESDLDELEALEPISVAIPTSHAKSHESTPSDSGDDTITVNQGPRTAGNAMPSYGASTTTDYSHEDDTDMLLNFLDRVKANKAAKSVSSIPKRKRSLPHSPLRLPLGTMDANSSPPTSPRAQEDDVDTTLQVESPPKRRKRHHTPSEEDTAELKSVRRSGRTRLPVKTSIPVPSFIPIRRPGQGGDGTLTIRRSEEKDLATMTRINTRKNKGKSLGPLEVLAKQAQEKADPASRQKALKEVFDEKVHEKKKSKKGKTVIWAEELVAYQTEEGKKVDVEKEKVSGKGKRKEKHKVVILQMSLSQPVSEEQKDVPATIKHKKLPTPSELKKPSIKTNTHSKMALGMAGNGTPASKSSRKTRGHAHA